MNTSAMDPYGFDNLNTIGPECEPDCPVPTDVWAKVLDLTTKKPTGFVKRKYFRSYQEVYRDLNRKLDRVECPQCNWSDYRERGVYCKPCPKCGAETELVIDEYFSAGLLDNPNRPIEPYRHVACYALTGGSEGYYIHVDLVGKEGKTHSLAIGKTFRGWDHAWTIAKRCAELLGA